MRYILLLIFALITTFASAQVQFLGSPTTTVRNRGNFVSDSLFYLPKRTKAPSDTGAIRYQISDSALYVWTGSAWRSTGTAGSVITGSGVAGYMPEFTTATNIDTTRLYHSNGRFGIGTTSPSSFLDVIGTKAIVAGEQEGIRVIGSIGGRQGISLGYDSTSADQYGIIASHTGSERTTMNYLAEKHKFTFGQVETAALYIDSLGNVGIRNTSPTYILDVSGTMRSTGNTYLGTTSAETYINTTSDAGAYALQVAGAMYATGNINFAGGDISISNISNNVLAFGTNNTERMRIKSDGEVLIGTTTDAGAYALQVSGAIYNTAAAVLAASGFNDVRIGSTSGRQISGIAGGMLQVWDNPGNYGGITIHGQNANNAFGNYLQFIKSRGTGNTVVQNGDDLGGLYFAGADGTNYIRAASMRALIDATPGTNDMPTALVFETTADGGTVPSERMRITNRGNVGIGVTPKTWLSSTQVLQLGTNTAVVGISGATRLNHNVYFDASGTPKYMTTGEASQYLQTGGIHIWSTVASGSEDATATFATNMQLSANAELLINTTSDAGDYKLQVNGDIYNTGGALFAQSSGNVGIGISGPTSKLHVNGTIRGDVLRSNTYAQYEYWYRAFGNMSTTNATPANFATTLNGTLYYRIYDVTQQSGLGSAGYVLGIHDDNNGYGYTWQILSDFSGNMALRAASSSTAWKSPYMLWKSDGEVLIGTTTDAGAYALQVSGAIYNTTTITTGAPTGGSIKPWRLGEAATVSPTSPNRTIRVEIDGTVYYIHAKTTND